MRKRGSEEGNIVESWHINADPQCSAFDNVAFLFRSSPNDTIYPASITAMPHAPVGDLFFHNIEIEYAGSILRTPKYPKQSNQFNEISLLFFTEQQL